MTKRDEKKRLYLSIFWIVAVLALLAAGIPVASARDIVAQATSPGPIQAETEEPEPTPEETLEPEPTPEETPAPGRTPEETPGPTNTPETGPTSPPAETPGPEEPEEEPTPEVEASPTAMLTPSPTPTSQRVLGIWATVEPSIEQLVPESEPLAKPPQLSLEEWLRLALAMVIVVVVAVLGSKLIHRVLERAIERKPLGLDSTLLEIIRPLIGWWLGAVGFHIATIWVGFQDEAARQLFQTLVFLFYLGVGAVTAWRLVDYALDLYVERAAPRTDDATLEKLLPAVRRFVQAALLIVSVSIALGQLGGDYTFVIAAIGVGGLALTLAMEDTIADIIAGFTILIDQPFRVGDRIEIEEIGTWGDVVEIGLRTTDIRTRDNRMVTVPNSTIGKNQVINYTFPDPQYRIETQVGIAYGTDIEMARSILVGAARHVEGVLPDKPVEALYIEMGDSAMIFRVRWWIESYVDTRHVIDQVHTALQHALDEAGIESPFPTQSIKLRLSGPGSGVFQSDLWTIEQ